MFVVWEQKENRLWRQGMRDAIEGMNQGQKNIRTVGTFTQWGHALGIQCQPRIELGP